MCGRFTLTADPDQLRESFPWLEIPEGVLAPRYNIAPSQPVAVIPNDGKNRLDFFLWGLIPSWAKDPAIGNRLINARAESADEKPAFRAALRRRRCLILADGFYEWKTLPGRKAKQPVYVCRIDNRPFAFAGLWEIWNAADGSQILSCAILTTQPNDLLRPIHSRMPVILPEEAYATWLEPAEIDPRAVKRLLKPFPSLELKLYEVSTLVNNPANEDPACVQPLR